jgi:hypothetical protein
MILSGSGKSKVASWDKTQQNVFLLFVRRPFAIARICRDLYYAFTTFDGECRRAEPADRPSGS